MFSNLGFTPTKSEIQIAREVWAKTPDVNTKSLLSQFSRECPKCGASYDQWKLLPPIKQSFDYDIVKYQCHCGCVFKKIEEKG